MSALRLDLVELMDRPLWVDVLAGAVVVLAGAALGLVLGVLLMYAVALVAFTPPG